MYEDILSKVDHTLLSQTATWSGIKQLCDDAVKYGCASVCIPPSYVKQASEYLAQKDTRCAVCTVIGFPNGYSTTATKVFETKDAIANGADEIDMVINIGWVKDERWEDVQNEINAVAEACGDHILKVIIETCLLTEKEKIRMCKIVSATDAEYIKTSTGFSTGGATPDDVRLMRRHTAPVVKVKAAGGISSLVDAEEFISLGADRLGTSRIVKIIKQKEN